MAGHTYKVGDEVQITKDLSRKEPEVVGCEAMVMELLHMQRRGHPQYKVTIFGGNKPGVRGGVFEVDEREIAPRPPKEKRKA